MRGARHSRRLDHRRLRRRVGRHLPRRGARAKLLIGKVCGDESAILVGMQSAAPQVPVINMSLGGGDTPDIDPLEQVVNELTARYDTLFVIAGIGGRRAHRRRRRPR